MLFETKHEYLTEKSLGECLEKLFPEYNIKHNVGLFGNRAVVVNKRGTGESAEYTCKDIYGEEHVVNNDDMASWDWAYDDEE